MMGSSINDLLWCCCTSCPTVSRVAYRVLQVASICRHCRSTDSSTSASNGRAIGRLGVRQRFTMSEARRRSVIRIDDGCDRGCQRSVT